MCDSNNGNDGGINIFIVINNNDDRKKGCFCGCHMHAVHSHLKAGAHMVFHVLRSRCGCLRQVFFPFELKLRFENAG